MESFYDRVVVGDEALARSTTDGPRVAGTQLRDASGALDAGHYGSVRPAVEADLDRWLRRLDDPGRRLGDVEGRSGGWTKPTGKGAR